MTTVNPGNGNRDNRDAEYVEHADNYDTVDRAEIEVEEADAYQGSHRRRDEYDADHAAVAGDSTAAAAGGIPKRGLAMILIAVAAILLLWALYAVTQNDTGNSDDNAAPASTEVTSGKQSPSAQPAPSSNANGGANGAGNDGANGGAAGGANNTGNSGAADGADNNGGAAGGANGAPNNANQPADGAALTRESAQIYVFNNSPVPDLAGSTAETLDSQYNVANRSQNVREMNLPEQNFGIFPDTAVYFDPSVSGAEEIAADVAQQVRGVARPINDIPQGASLPPEARANRNAVSVVLAG